MKIQVHCCRSEILYPGAFEMTHPATGKKQTCLFSMIA
jgi:hypothetical protein